MAAPSPASDIDGSSPWVLSFFSPCCAPLLSCFRGRPRRSTDPSSPPLARRTSDQEDLLTAGDEREKTTAPARPVVASQPGAQPQLSAVLDLEENRPNTRESRASGRTLSSSLRKYFRSDESMRRPQISGPSNFRHLQSGSGPVPDQHPTSSSPEPAGVHSQLRPNRPARPSSFRPLELSIYRSSRSLSPMLPLFEFPDLPAAPQPAQLQERLDDDHQLLRHRDDVSTTPFHLPRRPGSDTAAAAGPSSGAAAAAAVQRSPPPARPAARARAHTSPELEVIKARVAGAMIEAERLQQRIDHVIERQSLYTSSRPSSSHSMARTTTDLEPMPSIPALPPLAPSFAERLNSEIVRPQTAPLKPRPLQPRRPAQNHTSTSSGTVTATTVAATDGTFSSSGMYPNSPLSPPLPLVLRPPPLRKKKSFSRVSSWLFPGSQHSRDMSLESVTNLPRPVKGTEGFYQCVAPGGELEVDRRSFESIATVSTWDSDEGRRTAPTTWSPGSLAGAKMEEHPPLERTTTFGQSSDGP